MTRYRRVIVQGGRLPSWRKRQLIEQEQARLDRELDRMGDLLGLDDQDAEAETAQDAPGEGTGKDHIG